MAETNGKRGRKGLTFGLLGIGALLLAAAAFLGHLSWSKAPYETAAEAARKGDTAAALTALELAATRAGHEAAEAELRGQLLLLEGEMAPAEQAFVEARAAGDLGEPALDPLGLAEDLLSEGREAELKVFTDHLEAARPGSLGPELWTLAGLAHHAAADLGGAIERYDSALEGMTLRGPVRDRISSLRERAKAERSAGRMAIVLARDGTELGWRRPDGSFDIGPELAGVLGKGSLDGLPGLDTAALDGQVVLSLDPVMQRNALRVFRREQGAFLALSVETGEILAAAGSPELADGAPPFTGQFQPGSTLKVLTMAAYLEADEPVEAVLPHRCDGNDFVLEGQIVYDWSAHGEIGDLGRALATSCNTVFCKLGLRLGDAGFRRALAPFGLDGEALMGAGGESFSMGALPKGPLSGRRLARTAIGLDKTTVTPLQAAVTGLVMARGGELLPPRLVKARRNVAGDELETAPAASSTPRRVFSAETTAAVVRAMKRVVDDTDGTGRGVRTAGVSVAIKTGTTGGDGQPLNAAFVGFFPADRPEIAFAFFTQESGRSLEVSRRVLGPFLRQLWEDYSATGGRYSG